MCEVRCANANGHDLIIEIYENPSHWQKRDWETANIFIQMNLHFHLRFTKRGIGWGSHHMQVTYVTEVQRPAISCALTCQKSSY
jgi:hypothetical protein